MEKYFKDWRIIVSLIVAMIYAAVGGLTCLSDKDSPSRITSNLEIILEHTSNMQQPFDGVTKLDAAKTAVNHLYQNLSNDVNVAVRIYGGACGTENSELAVDFAPVKLATISSVMDTLKPRGKGSLPEALRAVVQDFSQQRVDAVHNTVIVLTGGIDSCDSGMSPSDFMRSWMENAFLELPVLEDVRLIGIGVNEERRVPLEEIAAAFPNSAVFVTDNTNELIRASGQRAVADSLQQAKQLYFRGKELYNQGEFDKALPLLTKAAKENIAAATHYLGTIYFYGRGSTSVDYEKAVNWYRKGAELNNPIAMFNLGVMFDPDVRLKTISELDSAKYWYGNAAAFGHQEAEQRLQELEP